MANNINVWFQKKEIEAVQRYAPHGLCKRCGEPMVMWMDTFTLQCSKCGMVMK